MLLLLATCRAAAGAPDVMSEQEFLGDVPVVLSASRLSQPVSEAPMATTVIDRETIRTSGFRSIPDLLRLVPGMYVGSFKGDQPVVSYHGLSDAYARGMQFLVDGRSIYMPSLGGVEWTDLPISVEDIERIEVVRGPDAATYGSNSFYAVVNIITVAAVQARGTSAFLGGGEGGYREGVLRHGGTFGDVAYSVGGGYRGDAGFPGLPDGQRTQYLNGALDFHPGVADAVHIYLGGTRSQRSGSLIPCNTNCADNQAAHSSFEQLRWTHQIEEGNELSLQVFHDTYRNQESAFDSIPFPQPDGSNPQFQITSSVRTERYDMELQQTLAPLPGVRWVWGANVRHEELYAPLFFDTQNTLSTQVARAFAHGEWRALSWLLVQGGAMVEHTSIAGSGVSPNLALNAHLTPSQTVRLSISHSTRSPLLYEDFAHTVLTYGAYSIPSVVGRGNLSPETILSRELGYLYAPPGGSFSVDLKAFSDRVADLIDTLRYAYPGSINNGKTTGYANLRHVDQQGLEGALQASPWSGSRITLNAAYLHAASPLHDYVSAVPHQIVSVLAAQRLPGNLSASIGYYQTARVTMLRVFTDSNDVPLMRRMDARLAWAFGDPQHESELAIRAQNVLGPYQDYFLANVFRQRLDVSLSTHF